MNINENTLKGLIMTSIFAMVFFAIGSSTVPGIMTNLANMTGELALASGITGTTSATLLGQVPGWAGLILVAVIVGLVFSVLKGLFKR